MSQRPPVVIRDAASGDMNFLKNSVGNSLRSSLEGTAMPNEVYWPFYYPILCRRVVDEGRVRVMVLQDDTDSIIGWISTDPHHADALHYVYVKEPFRGFGFARMLCDDAGITAKCSYSLRHKAARKLEERYPTARYRPIVLLMPKEMA
jgi:GNAT superfamily N-acetyltransferase